ncbi:MAG: class I SAM-dependent methyltransferase, partial [Parcubacteria group bacterium]
TDALKSLKPFLKRGGRLYLYLPAFKLLFSSLDKQVGHYRRYHKRDLIRLLESTGYQVQRVHYADTLGFFVALAYRLLRIKAGAINRRALFVFDRFVFPLNRVLDPLIGRWFGKNIEVVAVHHELDIH